MVVHRAMIINNYQYGNNFIINVGKQHKMNEISKFFFKNMVVILFSLIHDNNSINYSI